MCVWLRPFERRGTNHRHVADSVQISNFSRLILTTTQRVGSQLQSILQSTLPRPSHSNITVHHPQIYPHFSQLFRITESEARDRFLLSPSISSSCISRRSSWILRRLRINSRIRFKTRCLTADYYVHHRHVMTFSNSVKFSM